MKTLREFVEEAKVASQVEEEKDAGTVYGSISDHTRPKEKHPTSGRSNEETLSGNSPMIYENLEDRQGDAWADHEELLSKVTNAALRAKYKKEFEMHSDNFNNHYEANRDEQAAEAVSNMEEVNNRLRNHIAK